MHITLRSMTKRKSYNHVVLPGKWNVRDAIPEKEKNTKKNQDEGKMTVYH